jgi:putative transposase
MQLTAKVKLVVTAEQAKALEETIRVANECCNYLSERAWKLRNFSQFSLHKATYYETRGRFKNLGSCVVVRCTSKVAQAYKVDRKVKRVFRPLGAIEYDKNLLSWCINKQVVSIWTLAGRLKLPFVAGQRQLDLLRGKIGQADLSLINGEFYLSAPCFVETPEPLDFSDVLGVDVGIVNLAVDSDGESFSGKDIEDKRRKYAHRRKNLQHKQTRSAKRKLKKISGRQSRYQKNTNHCIAKRIVQKAHDTGRAIALEDLSNIRQAKVRRRQRARHANWSFRDLITKIAYKAARLGVAVLFVDPRNSSRTCENCGHCEKANRTNQSKFVCKNCGYAVAADYNAARVLRARALVNAPMVASVAVV